MARFVMELPESLIKDLQTINNNADQIFGEMTKAGAETVFSNVKSNMPASLRSSNFMSCVHLSRVYKTPSDGGINTKVGIWGYFTTKEGRTSPAPLVANMFEYGSSKKQYPKRPFFRRSFRKEQIEKAMLEAQKRASGGIITDE